MYSLENLMMVWALFWCNPRGCSTLAMASTSPFLAMSGLGHLLKNFHSSGIAALPETVTGSSL